MDATALSANPGSGEGSGGGEGETESATATATGSGKITVTSALSWGGSGGLTLKAGEGGIAINAAVTSTHAIKRNLSLRSIGSITSSSDGVLTINSLSATSGLGGIALLAQNRIKTITTLSAKTGAAILLRNQQALSLAAGASLSAGVGMVALLLPGYDLTLLGAATVEAGASAARPWQSGDQGQWHLDRERQ